MVAFHERGQTFWTEGEGRNAVVANQRKGECYQLTSVRGVGKTFGIAHHSCVKHHFACHGRIVTKRLAVEFGAVLQNQCYISHYILEFLFVLINLFDVINEGLIA